MSKVWAQTLRVLEEQLPAKDYATWIVPIRPSGLEEGTATLQVPNGFFRDWVRQYFMRHLTDALTDASGQPYRVSLVVNSELGTPAAPDVDGGTAKRTAAVGLGRVVGRLVPEYTLENFVVGAANELAVQAAIGVSSDPGCQYNPLFIHGGVGVGKTHLLNAVGHRVLRRHGRARVGCLTGEAFVNAMIAALRRDQMEAFRARFRHIDVLIIDDVQFLGGKVRSQEEFFHTFNTLRDARKQIVLASDRPPEEIRDLQECLQSRFSSGLLAPIAAPDEALRAEIVGRKATALGIDLSSELIDLIAGSVQGNVRQLEGILNALRARAVLGGQAVTRGLVREVLGAMLRSDAAHGVATILGTVSEEFGVAVGEITSARRTARVVEARQVAIYLARELTDLSLAAIGRRIGGRDHSTVVYALARVNERSKVDPAFSRRLAGMRERCAHG